MLRIQDKIRKGGDKKAFQEGGSSVQQVQVNADGSAAPETFLPKTQDVIEVRDSAARRRDAQCFPVRA